MNLNEKKLQSILDIDNGSIKERADYELEKVTANMKDINTDPKAKRKITIELTFSTDENRKAVFVSHIVKTKLAPPVKREITLFSANEIDKQTGEVFPVLKEHSDVPAGQINIDGDIKEQEVFVIGSSFSKHVEEKKKDALNGIREGEIATGGNENE